MGESDNKSTGSSLRSQDPVEYTARGWFPVNIPLLKEIQAKLRGKVYEQDRDALVKDIRSDFSLFGYCLRKIGLNAQSIDKDANPIDALRTVDIELLKECINVPADLISSHVVDPALKAQGARIRHLIVSCSAAEVMSDELDLDPDIAFSCAFARQLGYALVAYNYPRIYTQALTALRKDGHELERTLKKVLGLSPLHLGLSCSFSWNENPLFRLGSGALSPEDLELYEEQFSKDELEEGAGIRKICEVSEELARLSDPEHFPSSTKRWAELGDEIDDLIGQNGLSLINHRLKEVEARYLHLAPTLFKSELSPERIIVNANKQYSRKLLSQNGYIKSCNSTVQRDFERVYDAITSLEPSKEGLQILVSELIPQAGFGGGCIYLADLKKMRLVPTVRIGSTDLKSMKILNLADEGNNRHPAVDAIGSMSPVRQENVVVSGTLISYVGGVFGAQDKTGVLFLHMGPEMINAGREVSLILFKAIRHCLNDCLKIKG